MFTFDVNKWKCYYKVACNHSLKSNLEMMHSCKKWIDGLKLDFTTMYGFNILKGQNGLNDTNGNDISKNAKSLPLVLILQPLTMAPSHLA